MQRTLSSKTILLFDQDNTLTGHLENPGASSFEDWPHPWQINLSEENSDNKDVFQKLVELHIKEKLQPGDKIIGFKSDALNNVGYIAKMFQGEYQVYEQLANHGKIVKALTRVAPVINANIHSSLPESSAMLESELETWGHMMIRSGELINETQVLELIKGTGKPMDYNRYGTTTRKKIKNSKALQVTPWAKEVILPAHNEMTHHTQFPKNMAFLCKEPAEHGGETAIYDCARAFENLSPGMQQKISSRNVICRKRYVESSNDLRYISWKQVLGEETTRAQAMEHFSALGYQCHYLQEEEDGKMLDILEIHLLRPLVYQYRGNTCLHASMVPLTPFWYRQIWPGKTPPLMVTWEDGQLLTYEEFYELDRAILKARIRYDGWQKHDVLIVDNPRVAHGRLPYSGERLMGGLMAQPARFIQDRGQWQVEVMN